ncbi:DUF262 domain-containing protein [Romeria aff. gracilis LEGE 07310]|uniref:DUF262 domain-containing protein n=1 Tax=Vasconcelosia minhoensis LEGE 07310 TaxID=915328 RepID=A0A8J7DQ64_9CYAN|nr:DUF262 domain-containing protein [Romeria gracilis]MBE9075979.1 DUF262 domain-containing protein [Romeria aff. gracilis LEGE 07310]
MAATNFNTKNDTYRKLMGNGLTYRIPPFQRDYSWTEAEWEDLWLDILGTLEPDGEPAHYMGYLVLQSQDDKTFDVIDGQQRLTTLSLIVLATLKHLQRLIEAAIEPERTKQRLEQLRQTYVGYLDPVTLVPRAKLTLNRNNDNYYQTYLIPLVDRLPQRGFRASEHSLRKAFSWFDKRLGEYLRKSGETDQGRVLAQFVDQMSDKLFFTVITVTDELNAYRVFETLNARGVRLSSTDLLKNYLFSVLHRRQQHEHELKTLEDRWESMVGRLGSESFPDFLRVHWNSRHSFVRQAELFKTIRSRVTTREQVFNLLREMDEDIDTYLGLSEPELSAWSREAKDAAGYLRMFSVRQPFPLLLAARRQFSEADFETLLRAGVVFSFRYNVIGSQPPSEQERVYNQVAQRLSKGEFANLAAVLGALTSIYLADEPFRAAFADKTIRTTQSRNRRLVRYLLCQIERHVNGPTYDFDSDRFNLEHVLPQNPEVGWEAFSDDEAEAMVYRLGNMTLCETKLNRDLSNADYSRKREGYQRSNFLLTQKIAVENADWTPERVAARQSWMAKQATAIWRIPQLSG